MKRLFRKDRRFRKRLAKTKERIVKTIQLLNATTLQQMSEEKKKKENEKMISADEKPTKNVKMKRIMKKKFSKEKENFDTMMFEIADVKNSNAVTFIKYYINDTTTISSNFTKFFFEFENFLKKKDATQTHEKKQKKKKEFEEERERKLQEDEEKRQMNEFLFFI